MAGEHGCFLIWTKLVLADMARSTSPHLWEVIIAI